MHIFLRWFLSTIIISGIITIGCATVNSKRHHELTLIKSIDISVNEIQRDMKSFNVVNNSLGNAEWNWQVYISKTDSLVATSSAFNPTFELPKGNYDFLVTASGQNTLKRHFRRIITVLPPVFTEAEADEVIDLSAASEKDLIKDYKGEVRPGYKIIIKGSIDGRVKITGLRGTRENPVHIINSGQVTITAGLEHAAYPMLWSTGNQYIIVDGKADPAIEFGFLIKNHPKKSGQAFFIAGEFNCGFEICGLHIIGRQGFAQGATAIQLQSSHSPTCNAKNWTFDYFHAHHNKIEEATNEGFYIGYFTDHKDSTMRPYRLGEVLIYRNKIKNSGRDGVQISSADLFEVHDNDIDSSGLDGARNHNSAFSWNDGNIQGYCYRNTFTNCAQAFALFFGQTGKEAYIYSNLMIQGNYPKTSRTDNFNYFVADNSSQPVAINIFNNTMITNNLAVKIKYKNAAGKGIPILFVGNALSVGKISPKYYPDLEIGKHHEDSTSWTVQNVWQYDSIQKKPWDQNFKPVSKKSDLFKKGIDVQKLLPAVKGGYYDHDGYPFETTEGVAYGCYSGYELFIEK